MIGQALKLKSDIEIFRSQNYYGTIVWQFNEIWPTGGWGSVEYGTPGPGQVIGGRWKPLQYWYRKTLYTDIFITCDGSGNCLVRNDNFNAFVGTVTISSVVLSTGAVAVISSSTIPLPAGPGAAKWFTIDIKSINVTSTILRGQVTDVSSGEIVCDNIILLAIPQKLILPNPTVNFTVLPNINPDGSVDITYNLNAPALWLTFTTLANGRFSDNSFLALPPGGKIQFLPWNGPVDLAVLSNSLRVEHVATYR